MKAFFTGLFEYNHHCNRQLEELFAAHAGNIPGKVPLLYSHILNAHHIWNSRIIPSHQSFTVWQLHAMETFQAIGEDNFKNSLHILSGYDIEKLVSYNTSRGDQFSNSIKDILFHVINHSTYHRAQIATELKQAGIAPVSTDYIFYKR